MSAELAPQSDAAASITALYRALLRRRPQAAELSAWCGALLHGVALPEIRAAFLASDEYQQLAAAAERLETVRATGLFDPDWYLAANADVAAAGVDPLDHYCRFGLYEHRAPNAYFVDPLYRAAAGIPAGTIALLDYATRGERRGIPPGPHFDPAWYRASYGLAESDSALAHFLAHRARGHVAPSPRLWSLTRHRRAAATPDPFAAFLTSNDDLPRRAAPDCDLLEASGLFDPNHYQIINGDVAHAGMDMLVHYCLFGWKEGRNPNFYFDQAWYLATNPDVRALQVNPLVHYLLVGEPGDRRPVVYFEPGWYRRTYNLPPDASPLAHYLAHRHSQRFAPNSLFDPAWYRTQCHDAPRARRDLFAHYLIFGMRSDIQPSPHFDARDWRRRTTGRPSRHFPQTQMPERDNPLVNYMLAHYR